MPPARLVSGPSSSVVDFNLAEISHAFCHPTTGQWTLHDRTLRKALEVPKAEAAEVAAYAHAHFRPMANQWINPAVILRLSYLPRNRIKIITLPPSSGVIFHGGHAPGQIEGIIEKAGLLRATTKTFLALRFASVLNPDGPLATLIDGSVVPVALDRIGEVTAAADAAGWLGAGHYRTNPDHVQIMVQGTVGYQGGYTHHISQFTLKARYAFDRLPWLEVGPERRINLAAIHRFSEGARGQPAIAEFGGGFQVSLSPELAKAARAWRKQSR